MKAEKRKLGNINLSVNPIGLGTAYLAVEGRPNEADAIHIIHKALDAGIEFLDTADAYCIDQNDMGYCERLIAKALKNWQGARPFIATKGGVTRHNGDWGRNGRPEYIKAACNASLKSLNVDCIDLYQFHASDSKIPFEESITALVDLKQAGKIRQAGLSNVSVEQIKSAQKMIEIMSVQNLCNPYNVEPFRDGVLEYCEKVGLTFIPYSPVGGATQKHLTAEHPLLLMIAKQYQITSYQVVLIWLLAKSPVMLPIPGASKLQNALDSAAVMSMG